MRTKKPPFKTLRDEAIAIQDMLEGDVAKKLGTYNPVRIAAFKCDGEKACLHLYLKSQNTR